MNAEHQNANFKLHTGKHKSNTIHSEVKDDHKKNQQLQSVLNKLKVNRQNILNKLKVNRKWH